MLWEEFCIKFRLGEVVIEIEETDAFIELCNKLETECGYISWNGSPLLKYVKDAKARKFPYLAKSNMRTNGITATYGREGACKICASEIDIDSSKMLDEAICLLEAL